MHFNFPALKKRIDLDFFGLYNLLLTEGVLLSVKFNQNVCFKFIV